MTTFDTVRKLGLALPGVEESTSYGTPALKVRGQLVARLWEDAETLVIRMEHPERAELMAEAPDVYYITDHYRDYPWVLIHLSRIDEAALRELLGIAYRLAARDAAAKRGEKSPARKRKR
jgi:hypothetical protein